MVDSAEGGINMRLSFCVIVTKLLYQISWLMYLRMRNDPFRVHNF